MSLSKNVDYSLKGAINAHCYSVEELYVEDYFKKKKTTWTHISTRMILMWIILLEEH